MLAAAQAARTVHQWVDCDAFVLIAAMNPCPCGYFGDPRRACSCATGAIGRYQKRISGPLLDRIDIHLDVPRIPHEQLADRRPGELSAVIQERVERARQIQAARFAGTWLLTNADMGPKELRLHAALDDTAETLLGSAERQVGLSAHVLSTHSELEPGKLKPGLDSFNASDVCRRSAQVVLAFRPL
jgi:predicted ATPase with chaperone activity